MMKTGNGVPRRSLVARWRAVLAAPLALGPAGARAAGRSGAPETIADLIGLKLRVARPGQPLTMDYRKNQVAILLDEDGPIREIRRG